MAAISLLKSNAHYFEFRGKPTVLVTSAEHYGAVLNLDFDYRSYLRTLADAGLNLTRTWVGTYREQAAHFGIVGNTLNPAPGRFICPWPVAEGEEINSPDVRYDLSRWNAEFFDRLKDFLTEADRLNIVVELTFFCFNYADEMWHGSPMCAKRNVNGIGDLKSRHEAFSLDSGPLLELQEKLVRKVAVELNAFDNIYYEIINEPYCLMDRTAFIPWQKRIIDVLVEAEKSLPNKHLVAQNVQNINMRVTDLHPAVSVINFHYADAEAVVANYHLDRVIADDETGFKGQTASPYRMEAWRFMLSGGGVFNHLDYSFTVRHPDGSGTIESESPSFGGPELRRQLAVLKRFMDDLPLERMRPQMDLYNYFGSLIGVETTVRILADEGRVYAMYVTGGPKVRISLGIPHGRYTATWIRPTDGHVVRRENIEHKEFNLVLVPPVFSEDIALRLDFQGQP